MFANVAKTTEFDPDLEAVLKRGCFASCLVEPDGRLARSHGRTEHAVLAHGTCSGGKFDPSLFKWTLAKR
ncbi:hypothetical protein T4B_9608 [Trichinella pseudospiralis]|uniref:Uncharacterized protein n=1 Tax=Trichinella pseudospiralis TaxID=6337 RepID=A0A0V1IV64_TRIPS|nr:hypothetical protein T4E_1215 [Trichinella pseudospiralis]KRY65706.1 hypothetical protein T4A_12844 [Trichinella pseudospiralis]KRZ18989.1 hypothetical protein T4B_9608 [Trichinella pseudospiralis]KRZ26593.1 hypothetical protein T4C_11638 [Trichinella pseudospiralis]